MVYVSYFLFAVFNPSTFTLFFRLTVGRYGDRPYEKKLIAVMIIFSQGGVADPPK